MAFLEAGISTLGVKLAYGIGTDYSTLTKSDLTLLERVNAISGIELSTEQIDASALEDAVSKYVAGRQDTGGTWSITFNLTNEVETQLNALIKDYKDNVVGKNAAMFLEVFTDKLTKAFWVQVQPPLEIPMPEQSQNSLMTVEMTFTIVEYYGMKAKVEP